MFSLVFGIVIEKLSMKIGQKSNAILTIMLFSVTLPVLGQSSTETDPSKITTWRESLPPAVQSSILWNADHEEGSFFDWEYDRNPNNKGGGVFNTGARLEAIAEVGQIKPFTGTYCAKTTIHNAFQSQNGSKAVRLMRWTEKPWDQGGSFLPRSAYFGVWMRLDHNYSIRNSDSPSGGWWNVFQFKSKDKQGESQPVWVLNVGNHGQSDHKMHFYLYSKYNQPTSISQQIPVPLPVGRWFHVEALYEQSDRNKADGNISVWQDGQLILSAKNVKTVLAGGTIWGIGNYTDHVTGGDKPGSATIFFDDATISTKPTHGHVHKMLKR